jgi:hypothetical protein
MTTMDPILVSAAIAYKEELQEEYLEVLKCLKKYPNLFSIETIRRSNFYSIFAQVCSRCFGYGLPSTSMIPMADSMNHCDVTVVCETVTKSMHIKPDPDSKYYTKTKYMCDYSLCFSPDEVQQFPVVKGFFSRKNFEQNLKYESPAFFREKAQKNHLWQIPWVHDAFDEDNDTEEDESSSEEDSEDEVDKLASQLKDLINFTASKKFMHYVKRGKALRFFIKAERKNLE